jgi:hypothetical protein
MTKVIAVTEQDFRFETILQDNDVINTISYIGHPRQIKHRVSFNLSTEGYVHLDKWLDEPDPMGRQIKGYVVAHYEGVDPDSTETDVFHEAECMTRTATRREVLEGKHNV